MSGLIKGCRASILFSLVAYSTAVAQEIDLAAFHEAAERRISWRDPEFDASQTDTGLITASILGFNDFHGYLNGQTLGGRPIGGAAVLAAYLRAESAKVGHRAVIVHAGDMVGASPAESALEHDEPTIRFLNLLANGNCSADAPMDPLCNMVGTLGNHEFDEGPDEMMRLLVGGRRPDSDTDTPVWSGVEFPYVSANVVRANTEEPLLLPYVVKDIGGVSVAFIGAVLRETPEIVIAGGTEGLAFLDEAEAINRYVDEIRDRGIRAIVVTIHQGFAQNPLASSESIQPNEFLSLVGRLDNEVDVIISGHRHAYTNVLFPGRDGKEILVTQAFEEGKAFSDIDILLDPQSGEIVAKSAAIVSTWSDLGPGLTPDREIAAYVGAVNDTFSVLLSEVIGVSAVALSPRADESGESRLGNFLADAHRSMLGVDFAFTGSGRAEIQAGEITLGDLYRVSPFNRDLITMTLTGEAIVRLLSQQWTGRESPLYLAVSGFRYSWDANRPENERIVDIRDDQGRQIDLDSAYRVSVPAYFADGGEGFDVFLEGRNRRIAGSDVDILADYIEALPRPFEISSDDRIREVN